MNALLRVDNLTKRFGGLVAIDDCSFAVEAGSITALIGPNGAGKTTVFNLVAGFMKATSGQVTFGGRRIDGLAARRIFHLGLCRTFQIPRQFKEMSVIENVMIAAVGRSGEYFWSRWLNPGRVARDEEHSFTRAEEVLDFVNLLSHRDQPAGNLSGGQKKLLELARILMCKPKLILLDEPAAGVNPTLINQLIGRIETIRRQFGVTFLIVEHDMDMVARLCDHVIVMAEGRRLTEGAPADVLHDRAVLDAYLGTSS
ncbi:MAG: ABC transporter ATP-binding protein [Parvibaculaceae bacterium]